jgi:adenosylmethionine-8-amino-7-oxononanoate aminotransferase
MRKPQSIVRDPIWYPFTQMTEFLDASPLSIAAAEGCWLIDEAGRRYLDGVSSLWTNVHGHNHPVINAAIEEQLHRVAHSTMLGLTHAEGIELARRLIALAPSGLSRVFYSDSGATAVEIALKMAYQYWQLQGRPSGIVSSNFPRLIMGIRWARFPSGGWISFMSVSAGCCLRPLKYRLHICTGTPLPG